MSDAGAVEAARNLECERLLSGALLKAETLEEAAALYDTTGDLEVAHFRHRPTAEVFRIAGELIQSGRLPDPAVVAHELASVGSGNAAAFVASLLDGVRARDLAPWAEVIKARHAEGADAPDAEREPARGILPLDVEHVSALRKRHEDREAAGGLTFLWDGIVPDAGVFIGHIGPPKIGKTTLGMLLAHTAGSGGGELLGRDVLARRVLVLAVEDPPYYTEAMAARYFANADDVFCYAGRLKADPESLARIVETIKTHCIGLVVLFSLGAFWLVQDENDNAQVQAHGEAIRDAARRSRVPWVLDIHARKAEGQDGAEIRGAAALAGVLDAWISQRRGAPKKGESGNVRHFEVRGRLPHGGIDITASYDAEAGEYRVSAAVKDLGPDIAMRCRAVAAQHGGRVSFAALIKGLGYKDGGGYRKALRPLLLADGWSYHEEGRGSAWVVDLA